MNLWIVLTILTTVTLHELAHRWLHSKYDSHPKSRNRLSLINKFLEYTILKWLAQYSISTRDHWSFSKKVTDREKVIVAFGGVAQGLITALLIFIILAFVGMPQIIQGQFNHQESKEELVNELRIVSVDKQIEYIDNISANAKVQTLGTEAIRNQDHFEELNLHFKDKSVELVTINFGEQQSANIVIDENGETGVNAQQIIINRYGFEAVLVGVVTLLQVVMFSVASLWNGWSGTEQSLDLLFASGYFGYQFVLFFLAFISIAYSLLNLLPFPPFDMGRYLKDRRYNS